MAAAGMPGVALISGEPVTVLTPSFSYDEHMDKVVEWAETDVADVVVAPSSAEAVTDSTRLHGTRATLRLGFPKTFSASLRGCRVVVRGREYAVVGDPQPNSAANCPTPWWYTAEVEAVDG